MISITTTTPQDNSLVIIRDYKVKSVLREGSARISKTKTLDGGVAVVHSGFAEGDRKLNIECQLTEAQVDTLWDILSTETFVNVSIKEGLFDAAIRRVKDVGGSTSIVIEFNEKLTS